MIWVTLKNGEVRRYNEGGAYLFSDGWLTIGTQKPVGENTICRMLSSDVQRVEFEQPCQITRPPTFPNPNQTQLESALRIVLTEAKNVKDWGTEARLLGEVKNLLAGFNLKTKRFKAA